MERKHLNGSKFENHTTATAQRSLRKMDEGRVKSLFNLILTRRVGSSNAAPLGAKSGPILSERPNFVRTMKRNY